MEKLKKQVEMLKKTIAVRNFEIAPHDVYATMRDISDQCVVEFEKAYKLMGELQAQINELKDKKRDK